MNVWDAYVRLSVPPPPPPCCLHLSCHTCSTHRMWWRHCGPLITAVRWKLSLHWREWGHHSEASLTDDWEHLAVLVMAKLVWVFENWVILSLDNFCPKIGKIHRKPLIMCFTYDRHGQWCKKDLNISDYCFKWSHIWRELMCDNMLHIRLSSSSSPLYTNTTKWFTWTTWSLSQHTLAQGRDTLTLPPRAKSLISLDVNVCGPVDVRQHSTPPTMPAHFRPDAESERTVTSC